MACVGEVPDAETSGDPSAAVESVRGALTGNKLPTTLIAAPGWATPGNLLDGSTATKSTNAAKTASIELSLAASFQLTAVRVAEDNAGAQNVDAFGIQCWNGTAYAPELFRELNTPVAVPGFNEHAITGASCTTNRVKVNLYNDAALEAMEIELYGTGTTPPPPPRNVLVDAAHGSGGTMFPVDTLEVVPGKDLHFHFTPDAGYRVAQVCTPEYDTCVPWHDTEYTVANITGNDRIFWATFEPLPTGTVQIPVKALPGSTFATPAAVVDADVTNTKSLGTVNNVAYIDLDLGAYYDVTKLQIFEDNGAYEVDQYGLQCWNGFGFDAEIFRVNSANLVKPVANEKVIPEASCVSNRVRVNAYNNGPVEVFGVRLFGLYRNVFHSDAGPISLGIHKDKTGAVVETVYRIMTASQYVESLGSTTQPWTHWIYDEARPEDWRGTFLRNTVAMEGIYVRHCQTGAWTNIYETSYAPSSFPLEIDAAARSFNLYVSDHPDVENGFPDTAYDCDLTPPTNVNVLVNNVSTTIQHEGSTSFAYVLTHK
jgi:hypothetical protein